jgi:hypothetical protein
MKKIPQSEIEKKRYRAIRNAYGTKALADKARKWSDERILRELGVKVPQRMPELKPIPDADGLRRKQLALEKYQYATSQGIAPVEAIRLKQYKKEKIDTTKKYLNITALPITAQTKRERMNLWAEWSKPITKRKRKKNKNDKDEFIMTNNIPPALVKMAHRLNGETIVQKHQLDPSDRYGFAVVYYAFIENMKIEYMKEMITVDRYSGDRYLEALRA